MNAEGILPGAALLDTSVLLRLFHDHNDDEQSAADLIRDEWIDDRMTLMMLDLSIYEILNILVRKLGRDADSASRDVAHLFDLDIPTIAIEKELAVAAARLAAVTGLSGYDAAFVVGAQSMNVPLITADRRLADKAAAAHVLTLASFIPS